MDITVNLFINGYITLNQAKEIDQSNALVGLLVVLLGETLQAFRVQGGSEQQGELKSTTITRFIHSTQVMLDAIKT